MKKKVAALIVISLTIIITMILVNDPLKMGEILKGIDYFLILCVVGLYIINGFVKAARWHLLIRSSGSRIKFSKIYLFLLIGLMVNNTTPGRIGGEPVRAYLLRSKNEVPIGRGLSTIFVERTVDLIVLTSLALIGIGLIIPLLLASDIGIELLLLSFVPVLMLIVTLIYIATHPKFLKRLALGACHFLQKFSSSNWLLKAETGLIGFVESFNIGLDNMKSDLRLNKKNGFGVISLTLLIWLNEAGRIYLVLLALPNVLPPSFGAVLIVSCLATIFGAVLPIGAMHATLITSVFAALGVDIASATTAGILTIMTSIWLSIPLGIISMFIVGLKIDKVSSEMVRETNPVKEGVS